MSLRSALVLIFAALAWTGAMAQAPDCSAPNFCLWVDDDTCGLCESDTPGVASNFTCVGDADCLGVGSGLCKGTCADDPSTSCDFDSDCGTVCELPSGGFGTDPGTGGVPFCRIQRGYDGALPDTTPANPITVVVLPGTYQECVTAWGFVETNFEWDPFLSRDAPVKLLAHDFLVNGNNDTTIIDGTLRCKSPVNEADSVVKLGGTGARLEGFTITGGSLSGVVAQGEVVITNNVISGNDSELGGGIYLLTASCYYLTNVDAEISNNIIENNRSIARLAAGDPDCQVCTTVAPCGTGDGGGIFAAMDPGGNEVCNQTDNVEIRGNTIRNNTAENFNLDPCTSICENSPDPQNPIVCALPEQPDCPAGTGPCTAFVPYTSSGAGAFVLTKSDVGLAASAVVTQNLISGNSIVSNSPTSFAEGYGGGIYAVTFGYGMDTVEIMENCIGDCSAEGGTGSGNSATLDGGGISARARPNVDGRHTIVISDNTVTGNAAERDGGGLEVLTEAVELGSGVSGDGVRLVVKDNEVSGNTAGKDGGGIKAVSDIRRTTLAEADDLTLAIRDNVIEDNVAGLGGGGALLIPIADADDFSSSGGCGPNFAPAESRIDFQKNLVVDNFATADDPGVDVIGGGILTLPLTFGDANAWVVIDQTTVAGNSIGPEGVVGGIEAQAITFPDCLTDLNFGASRLVVDRTIVANNTCPSSAQCIGVGGPLPAPDILFAVAASSDVFGHNPDYESSLFATDPPAGNITGDPLLNSSTYFPDACSPVFARFCHGDLSSCDVDEDCAMACSADSLTPRAACTVDGDCPSGTCLQRCVDAVGFYSNPDTTGDGAVDGQEILGIAVSHGAEDGVDDRFDENYDINNDGVNDGIDLSFFTSVFGEVCEP